MYLLEPTGAHSHLSYLVKNFHYLNFWLATIFHLFTEEVRQNDNNDNNANLVYFEKK